MHSPEYGLVIRPDPFPDESGLGFCLRASSRNGTDLFGLRRLLGVKETTQFKRADAAAMARVLHVDAGWLQQGLQETHRLHAGQQNYFGHRMYAFNHLRTRWPQVCAKCIHQYGYCRAVWDLSLSTVCVEHGCTLTTCCGQCRQALRWNRPSIDVGHCGHYIKHGPNQLSITDDLMRWQCFVEAKFTSGRSLQEAPAADWQNMLQPMTLGGAFMVVAAFGVTEKPLMPIRSGMALKKMSPTDWQVIIKRALDRLCVLESLGTGEPLSSLVAEPFLMRLLDGHASTADQQTAWRCLDRIFKVKLDRTLLAKHPFLGQQSLF